MKEKELEQKETLLDRELELLAEKVDKLDLDIRSRLDSLELDVKALGLFVEWLNPDSSLTFQKFREQVYHKLNPEKEVSAKG